MAQNLVLNILAKDKTKQAFNGIRAGLTNLRSSIFCVYIKRVEKVLETAIMLKYVYIPSNWSTLTNLKNNTEDNASIVAFKVSYANNIFFSRAPERMPLVNSYELREKLNIIKDIHAHKLFFISE